MTWRDDFPLEAGTSIEVDGETWTLLDLPTDGPLFRNEDARFEAFEEVQLTPEEAEDVLDDELEGGDDK